MDYNSVCDYILSNGGVVDDKKFRLNEADGLVFVDKWKYEFKKPNQKDFVAISQSTKTSESFQLALKRNQDQKKAERLAQFQKWEFYDCIVDLINNSK
jgi:hypothetical protein